MRTQWNVTIFIMDINDNVIEKNTTQVWADSKNDVIKNAQADAIKKMQQHDNADWWHVAVD